MRYTADTKIVRWNAFKTILDAIKASSIDETVLINDFANAIEAEFFPDIALDANDVYFSLDSTTASGKLFNKFYAKRGNPDATYKNPEHAPVI